MQSKKIQREPTKLLEYQVRTEMWTSPFKESSKAGTDLEAVSEEWLSPTGSLKSHLW